jgi:NAD(P)-dependent dehydrogenase (short-subunit alcohol dehydrogenase family)
MELSGARVVVAGATGVFGGTLTQELNAAGAEVALAGRDPERLAELADEHGAPTARLDAADPAGCERAVDALAAALGGLDAVAVTLGAPAFGPADELSPELAREVFEVNALAPMAVIGAALRHIDPPGAVVATSAIVADYPTAGVGAYSAAKAALSAYLAVVRRENRRVGVEVLDARPPHMDTGFEQRSLAGSPPELPDPIDHRRVAAEVVAALRDGKRQLAWDLRAKELVAS